MANRKKSSWLKKIANWVQDSLQRFAEEGFSEGKKKRRKTKPILQRALIAKTQPKKKSVKKSIPGKSLKKPGIKKPKSAPAQARIAAGAAKKVSVKKAPPQAARLAKAKSQPVLPAKAAPKVKPLPGVLVGKISHYFAKANACAFRVENVELKEGAMILIQGPQTKMKIKIKSIQINRIPVPSGKPGEDIGIGVPKPVAAGDEIYLLKS